MSFCLRGLVGWLLWGRAMGEMTPRLETMAQGFVDRARLVDQELDRLRERIPKLEKVIALLNSMVNGGECHSCHSRRIVREALDDD